MSEKRKATVEEAKAAWEAHPEPSIRNVVAALAEAGLECSISSLQRWKKAEWLPKEDPRRKTKKLAKEKADAEAASAKVSDAVKKNDGKAQTRIEVIAAEEAEMKAERDKLLAEHTLDSDLAREAMRESLIAQIVLARQIIRRAAFLVEVVPEIAAKLLDVLKGPAASTTIIIPPHEQKDPAPNGDGAKVVQGRLVEKSPTQLAIEEFEQRERHGVAA